MGVLLRLGEAELPQASARDPGAQAVLDRLVGEQHVHHPVEPLGVGGHPERRGEGGPLGAREALEGRVEQGAQDLAHPVGAEVGAEEPRALARAGVVADHGGLHELVGLAALVGRLHRGVRVRRAPPLAEADRAPRPLDPVPPRVAVHREEPAHHGSHTDALQPLDLPQQRRELAARRPRPDVAAVGDEVQHDGHARLRQRAGEGGDVALVAVDAAGAREAQQMRRAAGPPHPPDEAPQRLAPGEGAVAHGPGRCAAGPSGRRAPRRSSCVRPRSCPSAPRAGRRRSHG